jgi:8-oxo-dGTP pyrophosphatase MutT (NUDIX family)
MGAGDIERLLTSIEPYSPRRAAHKEVAVFFARAVPELASRETRPVHLTASTFVLDPATERVLLLWHPKYGRWLQPGGHCDGSPDLAAVALREVLEETGIAGIELDPVPFDVDLHPGEPGGDPHMHIDVRFVATAPEGSSGVEPTSPEELQLAWVRRDEDDCYIAEALDGALAHMRNLTRK